MTDVIIPPPPEPDLAAKAVAQGAAQSISSLLGGRVSADELEFMAQMFVDVIGGAEQRAAVAAGKAAAAAVTDEGSAEQADRDRVQP